VGQQEAPGEFGPIDLVAAQDRPRLVPEPVEARRERLVQVQ
jgi:hypothetical protein